MFLKASCHGSRLILDIIGESHSTIALLVSLLCVIVIVRFIESFFIYLHLRWSPKGKRLVAHDVAVVADEASEACSADFIELICVE